MNKNIDVPDKIILEKSKIDIVKKKISRRLKENNLLVQQFRMELVEINKVISNNPKIKRKNIIEKANAKGGSLIDSDILQAKKLIFERENLTDEKKKELALLREINKKCSGIKLKVDLPNNINNADLDIETFHKQNHADNHIKDPSFEIMNESKFSDNSKEEKREKEENDHFFEQLNLNNNENKVVMTKNDTKMKETSRFLSTNSNMNSKNEFKINNFNRSNQRKKVNSLNISRNKNEDCNGKKKPEFIIRSSNPISLNFAKNKEKLLHFEVPGDHIKSTFNFNDKLFSRLSQEGKEGGDDVLIAENEQNTVQIKKIAKDLNNISNCSENNRLETTNMNNMMKKDKISTIGTFRHNNKTRMNLKILINNNEFQSEISNSQTTQNKNISSNKGCESTSIYTKPNCSNETYKVIITYLCKL